jgi:hypothetical protein
MPRLTVSFGVSFQFSLAEGAAPLFFALLSHPLTNGCGRNRIEESRWREQCRCGCFWLTTMNTYVRA